MEKIIKYENFSEDSIFILIENFTNNYYDMISESKVKDWLIAAPKIKRLQEKANQERIQSQEEENRQRRNIDKAKEAGKHPKVDRMWELLQKKKDAHEEIAQSFEEQAMDLSRGNEFLNKVRRVAKMKGQLKVNREKIRLAETEEARELLRTNKSLTDKIKDDTKIVNDQLRKYEDRLEIEEAKKKASGRAAYFDEVRAEKVRQTKKAE